MRRDAESREKDVYLASFVCQCPLTKVADTGVIQITYNVTIPEGGHRMLPPTAIQTLTGTKSSWSARGARLTSDRARN